MVREITHDIIALGRKSEACDENDKQLVTDLLDTLRANIDDCVGMAANMIGENKRVIAIDVDGKQFAMINPEIIDKFGKSYIANEECMSLDGEHKAVRYHKVKIKYLDEKFKPQMRIYSGYTAQIIQHECDHLEGILI